MSSCSRNPLSLLCGALVLFAFMGFPAYGQQLAVFSAEPVYGQPPTWNDLIVGESRNAEVEERLGRADTTLDAGRTVLHLYGQDGGGEARVTVDVWDDVVHMIQLKAPDDERTMSAVRDKFGKPPLSFVGESQGENEPRQAYSAYPEKGVVFAVEAGHSLVRKFLVSPRALKDLQGNDS